MRALVTLLAAGTLIGGCACTEMDLIGLPVENGPSVAVDSTTTSVADERIPGGWWEYPDVDPSAQCSSVLSGGLSIPCRNVLLVCEWNDDSGWTNVMLPAVFSCTDESPTLADVCRTRPPDEWAWYRLDADQCELLT